MKRPFPPFLFALSLWLLAVSHPFAAAQEGIGEVLRPALVSSEMLEAKIAEADATELPDETKTKIWSGLVRALFDQVAQSPTAWFG